MARRGRPARSPERCPTAGTRTMIRMRRRRRRRRRSATAGRRAGNGRPPEDHAGGKNDEHRGTMQPEAPGILSQGTEGCRLADPALCLPNVSAHELPAGKIVDSRSEATSHTVHRLVRSMRLLGRLWARKCRTLLSSMAISSRFQAAFRLTWRMPRNASASDCWAQYRSQRSCRFSQKSGVIPK